MADVVNELLARRDVKKTRASSRALIDNISQNFKLVIPESLARLWLASDGLDLERLKADILGPAEIWLISVERWEGKLFERGFLPILDDRNSNYLYVMLREPLAFRVVYVPHDNGSRLLYRDCDSCLRDLVRAMDVEKSADMFLRRAQGDYPPDAPRPIEDQNAARALMATDGKNREWNYAAQLLDASNLAEWAKLLETGHFVRRDVRARMQRMTSPAIQSLLRDDDREFDAFANAASDAARAAGLDVGIRKSGVLQVGGHWMNLEAFFHRRRIRDAMPRMVAWFEDLIAGRRPQERADNFMSD